MAEVLSKSAKQRAAKKAREAAAAEEAAPAPVPAPAAAKSKAAAKSAPAAAAPAAKVAAAPAQASPKGKAQASPKGKAQAAPEPKASAKAAAKSQPAPAAAKPAAVVAEPAAAGKKKKGGAAAAAPAPVAVAAPAPQPATKAAAKGKAKAKAAPAPAPEPEPVDPFMVMDDGTGGDWGVAEGVSKKGKKKEKTNEVVEEGKPKNPLYKTQEPAGQQSAKGAGKGGGKGEKGDRPRPAGSSSAMEALTKAVQAEAAAVLASKAPRPVTAENEKADEPKAPQFVRSVEMPGDKIGRVIGPKGANIIKIQEHFDGKISRIDTQGGFCTISGEDEKAVGEAEAAIKELISRGFMSLSYKNLSEDSVTVKSMFLPEIIGKQGAIIKKIKEVTNVEIDIPQEGKGGKGGSSLDDDDAKGKGKGKGKDDARPVKIALVGEAENVAKAKAIIEDICRNYCHPEIHVDHVHAAMEVDPDNHRYVIGRGGSEMRHIQKNWNVKVNLPKWDNHTGNLLSESENVIIVGEQHDVDRAKAYIEKILANAAEDSKKFAEGAPPPKEDKYDKDEEPVEAWMKPYMYKR